MCDEVELITDMIIMCVVSGKVEVMTHKTTIMSFVLRVGGDGLNP